MQKTHRALMVPASSPRLLHGLQHVGIIAESVSFGSDSAFSFLAILAFCGIVL